MVAVMVTVRSPEVIVEFDDLTALEVLKFRSELSDPRLEDRLLELSALEVVRGGTVNVPILLRVTATAPVAEGVTSTARLPSLTATSTTAAVTVTSGARGRMTFPGRLLL